jgi:predicted ATPase
MIKQIKFKNYKIFKSWQTLEIKPITILIGKNNSGKSAIAKLPVLVAGSISGSFSAPINLNYEGIRIGYSNEELFYNREITLEPIELDIVLTKDRINVSISGDRNYQIRVSKCIINGDEIETKAKYNGFISETLSEKKPESFDFDYIDSFRKFPEPQFSDIYGDYLKVGISGENAYKLLAQYHSQNNPILNQIREWYKDNFEGWEIGVKDIAGSSPLFEVVLSTSKIKAINIVNTGSGIRQSLPLIVRSYMPTQNPTVIIIEEPETHLHPAAHVVLAQRFAESYLEDNNKKYLIETHSQNFVLRMRRLVAEGKLKPDDLAIYYVDFDEDKNESTLRMIEVDNVGGVDWWPTGIFGESVVEARAIYNSQLNDVNNEN